MGASGYEWWFYWDIHGSLPSSCRWWKPVGRSSLLKVCAACGASRMLFALRPVGHILKLLFYIINKKKSMFNLMMGKLLYKCPWCTKCPWSTKCANLEVMWVYCIGPCLWCSAWCVESVPSSSVGAWLGFLLLCIADGSLSF